MFLKRIFLHGFKSFADRTEFEFGPGITSVVGPNGCGKSNLVDAVRWVLGEQSPRSMRGSKMADVIFAGSRSRKPANAAEVALTFDNRAGFLTSDDEEVVVGRVLYGSGDSEYRLNGNSCRLKDIRDLFLDTGVGVDAYSFIEQGKVDVLLQSSPQQRREIFEEAAGISRYKVRRAEAQRKLERTQNNLLRLNDVIDELEKRLRSVKLAAGKARNFLQYDARLRELRSSFSLAEYHELEQQRLESKSQSDALEEALQAKRTELAGCDARAAELEHTQQALDEQIHAAESQVLALQTEFSALTERISQSERRLNELAEGRERQLALAADAEQRCRELEERIGAQDAALSELREAESRSSARIEALEAARGAAQRRCEESRAGLDQEKTAAFEAVRRSSLLQNEHTNLQQQTERLRARLAGLVQRRAQLDAQRAALASKREELEQAAESFDSRAADLSEKLRSIDAALNGLEVEGAQADERIGADKEARSALLSRLNLLQDMERRQEGVTEAARSILAWRDEPDHDGPVIGLVADILRIDDPRVELLQPILAEFENHLVVRDTYSFLAELSRRDELPGTVRLLTLDRVTPHQATISYADAPGFVARAVDWVRCAAEFKPLAENLLGRVIIVDVMERALALADGAPDGFVFVTEDGHTVAAGGRLSVGRTRGVAGLISRKAEIRRLQTEVDDVETRLERATRRRAEIEQAASDARLQREEKLQQIAEVQKRHADARNELARVDDEAQRVQRESSALGAETADLERSLDEDGARSRELQTECDSAESARRGHESQVGALERELAQREAAGSQTARELTDALVEVGRAAERRSAVEQTLNDVRGRLQGLRDEQTRAERDAERSGRSMQAASAELRDANQRQQRVDLECKRQQAAALQTRERRQRVRSQVEECGASGRRLHGEIEELDGRLRDRQVQLREMEVREETLVARVRDELSVDLAELYASYEHADQDWDEIKREIEELRRKIDRLGNVNLDAIAELEELTPRYDNLVAQRADLNDAVERLAALIEQLDDQSRTRFTEAFESIRENFHELFRKLFGGGKADIILEEPEQPLECGIEIIARPPGKEPQSISLLSGGEKTLTAVALLLAVFKSKPSPFAILDEVDAALDESNIDRFNTVVNEFLSRSQFIVITHNKRTMQCADVLYGITMEEPGVSKRMSVRFDDRVETPVVA